LSGVITYSKLSIKIKNHCLKKNKRHQKYTEVQNMEHQEAYEKAKKRVEAKMGFYIHLAVYIGVNLLLIAINLVNAPDQLWFKWPLMGWGIGLFFHGLGVFASFKGDSIKERMIEKEMENQKKNQK
jgi:hypothetical protein